MGQQDRNDILAQLWSLRARLDRHRRRVSHQVPLVFDRANHVTTNRSIPPPLIQTHRNNHDFIALLEFVRGNLAFLDVLEPQVDSLGQADVRGEFEGLQRDLSSSQLSRDATDDALAGARQQGTDGWMSGVPLSFTSPSDYILSYITILSTSHYLCQHNPFFLS